MNQVEFIWLLLFGFWMVFYRKKSLPKCRYYFDIHFLYRYFLYLSYIDIDIITPLEVNVTIGFSVKFYTRQCSYLNFTKFRLWLFFIRVPQLFQFFFLNFIKFMKNLSFITIFSKISSNYFKVFRIFLPKFSRAKQIKINLLIP